MRLLTICACVVGLTTVAPSPHSVSSRETTPFQIEVSPRFGSAPTTLTVRARLDPALVGGVCIVVDGAERHSSCWYQEQIRTPQVVTRYAVETPGEYTVVMRSDTRVSAAVDIILN